MGWDVFLGESVNTVLYFFSLLSVVIILLSIKKVLKKINIANRVNDMDVLLCTTINVINTKDVIPRFTLEHHRMHTAFRSPNRIQFDNVFIIISFLLLETSQKKKLCTGDLQ